MFRNDLKSVAGYLAADNFSLSLMPLLLYMYVSIRLLNHLRNAAFS